MLSKYQLVTELYFDAILYSKFNTENSDVGHIKCSCGPHLACRLQVPQSCFKR